MKLKKILTGFIITITLILLNATSSEASLHLKNLDFTAQINEDGSMDVVETWDINISETNTLYKTFKIDKTKYSGISNVFVQDITSGTNKNFKKSDIWKYHLDKGHYFGGINNSNEYEIAWGVSIDTTTRKQYLIRYTVKDVIKKYNDCAELYWQFVGSDFEVSADSITGIIKLPNKVSNKDELRVWGHTEYLNGEIYVTDLDMVEFKVNKYKSGNFVEVRIAMPTYVMSKLENTSNINKIDSIIEQETKWANEANEKRKTRDKNMKAIMIGITIGTTLVGIYFTTRISKNKKILEENPKIKPEYELDYYRELPDQTATPLEAVFMLKKGYNQMYLSNTFSATILDLILKGYVKVEQEEDGKEIKMEIVEKTVENLQEDELKVFDLLKSASNDKQLTMKDLEKYIKKHPTKLTNVESEFETISKKEAERKEKFSKAIANKAKTYVAKTVGYIFLIIITFMAMMMGVAIPGEFAQDMVKYVLISSQFAIVILIINVILVTKTIKRCDGFTQKGVTEREQWKAFKKYMEDFSYLNEKEVPQLVLWEKYLVFATAFGIADKVLKQLKVKYPELNDPDTIHSMILFNSMYNSNGFNTKFINSINTSTSRMYSSTYSSGSGSGGGFSGGGGFGGGGGRPEEEDKNKGRLCIYKVYIT